MPLRLGSRGSPLARWQAQEVQRRLAALGQSCEIVLVQTTGDRRTDVSLATLGGKGLFTRELELELAGHRLDAAVHSLKDVPSLLPQGMALAAILEREDPHDALIAAPGMRWDQLAHGARVGTSSLRRQAQALALRPDLRILPLRGNVDTRLRRWRDGDFDALLLAAAGLKRLGRADAIAEILPADQFCPSAGQGALALECRADDHATWTALQPLNHAATAVAVTAERALLQRLECGCQAPVGAYARMEAAPDECDYLVLSAVIASADGQRLVRRHSQISLPALDAAPAAEVAARRLGLAVAEALLGAGAAAILRESYA